MPPGYRRALWLLLPALGATLVFWSRSLRAGDNIEGVVNGGVNIADRRWDRRFYDGTPGWEGFVRWFHNPAGMSGTVTQAGFQDALQAGFGAWNAIDDGFGISPLIPIVTFQGTTSVPSAGAIDGVNAVVWFSGSPGGTLASTPCSSLTASATTIDGGSGNTVLPTTAGNIPFPGPIGATYPAGTLIDCGMQYDNADTWTTAGAVPGALDVQSIATHEEGHFIALSHSTVGQTIPGLADDATMIPFVSSNNIDFRTLHNDDIASAIRTYARVNGLAQTAGGRGRIIGTLKKAAGCPTVATGVSVRAYLASQGLEGANSVETFSGSQFRQGLAGEPFNGSFELNVLPGGPYTIYARTFESGGSGFYLASRYNLTTINSNTLNPPSGSQAFDGLATVTSISAGQTIDLGTVGMLCVTNDEISSGNLISALPSTNTENTTSATANASDPVHSCTGTRDSNTVWYRYVAARSGTLRVNTFGSNYDTVLTAYPGASSVGAELACNNDSGGTLQSQILFNVVGGQSYLIEASDYNSPAGGTLVLNVLWAGSLSDFDGNGVPDLILQNDATRQIAVWYMGGPQGNVLQSSLWISSTGVPGWSVVGIADMNQDGKPDMVLQNDASGQLGIWYMGGAQGNLFQSSQWITAGGAPAAVPGWAVVGIADMDQNGVPDLVLQNLATRQVGAWYMGGAQGNVLQSSLWISSAGVPGWKVVGTADLNQDSKPDIVLQNDASGQLGIWYLGGAQGNLFQSSQWITAGGAPAAIPGWAVVGIADMDQNGVPDLVLQNLATRQIGAWYMGGAQGNVLQSSLWISSTGVPGWRVIGAK